MYRNKTSILTVTVALYLLFSAGIVQAYNLLPYNWTYLGSSPTVNMKVNPNCGDASAVDELASLQSAMDSWTNAGSNFSFNYAGATSVTSATYYNFQNDMCWNPGSSGNALATTSIWFNAGNITQADVVFWDAWVWRTSTSGVNQYDVESVGVHELGHVLGLDHTGISAAVMYGSIGWWETKRNLYSDDINGIIAIYGSSGLPNISVTLTPTGSVNLPGSGGTIPYNVDIHNNEGSSVNFDGWTGIEQIAGGSYSEEMIVRTGLYIGGGGTISRSLSLYIAGSVPNGTYEYYAKVGDYSTTVYAEDTFEFYKYGDLDGSTWVEQSYTTWWDEEVIVTPVIPDEFQVSSVYPNPFNPTTTVAFDLPQATKINLSIYNLNGQLVSELLSGNLDAGQYRATWNATGHPSGTYIYRLNTDSGIHSGKMLLLK